MLPKPAAKVPESQLRQSSWPSKPCALPGSQGSQRVEAVPSSNRPTGQSRQILAPVEGAVRKLSPETLKETGLTVGAAWARVAFGCICDFHGNRNTRTLGEPACSAVQTLQVADRSSCGSRLRETG